MEAGGTQYQLPPPPRPCFPRSLTQVRPSDTHLLTPDAVTIRVRCTCVMGWTDAPLGLLPSFRTGNAEQPGERDQRSCPATPGGVSLGQCFPSLQQRRLLSLACGAIVRHLAPRRHPESTQEMFPSYDFIEQPTTQGASSWGWWGWGAAACWLFVPGSGLTLGTWGWGGRSQK